MKTRIVIFLILGAVALAASCGGANSTNSGPGVSTAKETPETRGEQIVAEFLRRDAAPFRRTRVRFTITPEGEPAKIYEIDTWRRQTGTDTSTLTQIVKPVEDSDLGSLTLESEGKKTVIVTYAVSRDDFRETDTNKMFFGGLTAGELLGEWGKFEYRLAGEKEAAGQKVFEVEGKLKAGASSGIARMIMLFRADNYLPVELRLFDSTGQEVRTYKVTEFKSDAKGEYPARTEVENPIYKTHIVIEVLSREFPDKVDESMFTREKLKQIVRK